MVELAAGRDEMPSLRVRYSKIGTMKNISIFGATCAALGILAGLLTAGTPERPFCRSSKLCPDVFTGSESDSGSRYFYDSAIPYKPDSTQENTDVNRRMRESASFVSNDEFTHIGQAEKKADVLSEVLWELLPDQPEPFVVLDKEIGLKLAVCKFEPALGGISFGGIEITR